MSGEPMRKQREKTSIIWTIETEKLQNIINNSDAMYKVLECLGLSGKSAGSYRVLKQRIAQDNLDVTLLNKKSKEKMIEGMKNFQKENRRRNEEIL